MSVVDVRPEVSRPGEAPARSVLLIGWRIATLNALRELGARVWCVAAPDVYRRFGHKAEVERVVLVSDCSDAEEILSALRREGAEPSDFDIVCSQHEFSLVVSALVGGDASPMPPTVALLLRDKYLQKKRIESAGLPVTHCRILPDTTALEDLRAGGPVVVKPILGASCANTFVIHGDRDLDGALAEFAGTRFGGPFLVEDFVTGSEHHVDGIVRDGELMFLAISRYLQNVINLRSDVLSGSVALKPQRYPDLYDKVRTLARDALRALGHRDGVFHMEVFADGDTVTFSECAGRVGGGPIAQFVNAQFGVDLHLEWARPILGAGTPVVPDPSPDVHGYGLLMAHGTGVIREIPDEAEIRELEGVVSGRPMVGPGHEVKEPKATSDGHVAEVVVRGATEEDVVRRLHQVDDWFRDRLVLA